MNINADQFREYANNPAAFRNDLQVDVSGTVRRFGDVMDDWQCDDFMAIDPGMRHCNGQSTDKDCISKFYLERSCGNAKTNDLAIICIWILAFATRPVKGYAFAADKDQAQLLQNAMDVIVRLNPWLGEIIQVQKNLVLNIAKAHPGRGARLEIFTSDVASSYGILPDFVIADRLTHWEGDGSLWHSIISSAAKRTNCLLAVSANAGFLDSWQWDVREAARTDESWYFHWLDGPQASWMTEESLAEQRKMLPQIAYSRLWENRWSSSGGDALTPEIINAAFVEGLQPLAGRHPNYYFVGGVDLGLTRDCAALIVLAVPKDDRVGKIQLVHHKIWTPMLGKKINLLEVERHILAIDARFGLEVIGFDPWQGEDLMQTLEADSGRKRRSQRHFTSEPWARETPPTAVNLRQQATLTIESFDDHRLQFYDCELLRQDLHKLRVEEKSYGMRLVSPRDGTGQGETASAFCLALVMAHELGGKAHIALRNPFPGTWSMHDACRQFGERQRA